MGDLLASNQRIRTIELFAGIGGFRLAAEENNLETVWANDIDSMAVKVYKSIWGDGAIVEGDIDKFIADIPEHDFLTGGFPCQPFSKAGKKQGINDYRGTLFESIVRILKEKSPRYFILENVNSLLYMDNGANFRTILAALSELDYKVEWRVYNAESFGLPQHRERVIITGIKGINPTDSLLVDSTDEIITSDTYLSKISDYHQWDVIAEKTGKFSDWGMAHKGKYISCPITQNAYAASVKLSDILEDNVDESFDFTKDTLERIKNSQYVCKYYNGVQILYNQAGGARMGYSIFGVDGVSPTLTASTSRHYERYKVGEKYRRLTNVEYARLQGFPDNYCSAISPYNQYKYYGNAVPHQIISHVMKRILSEQKCTIKSSTLTLFDFL